MRRWSLPPPARIRYDDGLRHKIQLRPEVAMICRNHVDVSEGVRRCSRCGSTFCRDCLVEIGGAHCCATCKTEQLLDVRSGVGGPLDLAPLGRRVWAYLADVLILYIANFLFGMVIGITMRGGAAQVLGCVTILGSLVLTILYDAILVATSGQT